jgi:hypothetical protein
MNSYVPALSSTSPSAVPRRHTPVNRPPSPAPGLTPVYKTPSRRFRPVNRPAPDAPLKVKCVTDLEELYLNPVNLGFVFSMIDDFDDLDGLELNDLKLFEKNIMCRGMI